jgi:hypothetical protein
MINAITKVNYLEQCLSEKYNILVTDKFMKFISKGS